MAETVHDAELDEILDSARSRQPQAVNVDALLDGDGPSPPDETDLILAELPMPARPHLAVVPSPPAVEDVVDVDALLDGVANVATTATDEVDDILADLPRPHLVEQMPAPVLEDVADEPDSAGQEARILAQDEQIQQLETELRAERERPVASKEPVPTRTIKVTRDPVTQLVLEYRFYE